MTFWTDEFLQVPDFAQFARVCTRLVMAAVLGGLLGAERESMGKAADEESVKMTRQRLASMEEFMSVTNKIFQQFVGNAKSGLSRVVKVLLKAL